MSRASALIPAAVLVACCGLTASPRSGDSRVPPERGIADSLTPPAQPERNVPSILFGSDPPGARVYRNGEILGATPFSVPSDLLLPDGVDTASIEIVGGAAGDWHAPRLSDTLRRAEVLRRAAGTGTAGYRYELPLALRITSSPSGAEVVLEDSVLGTTPLMATVPPGTRALILRKSGYREEEILLAGGGTARHALLEAGDGAALLDDRSLLAAGSDRSYTPVIVAAGSAVAAGAAAAWLKNEADRLYDDYRRTGDPGTLDRVRRFDTWSAVALVLAEIGVGYLVVDLLSR